MEAEKAYAAGDEALQAGDHGKAQAHFAKSQTAVWFWIAETLEAGRLALLQFVGSLPDDTGAGSPPAGK
jgi:hypothetical protein